jgi:hypothetical protein
MNAVENTVGYPPDCPVNPDFGLSGDGQLACLLLRTLEKFAEFQAHSFDLANLAFPNSQDPPSSLP